MFERFCLSSNHPSQRPLYIEKSVSEPVNKTYISHYWGWRLLGKLRLASILVKILVNV